LKTWLPWFFGFSVAGLVASFTIHVFLLAGLPIPEGRWAWILHVGCMVAIAGGLYSTGLEDRSRTIGTHLALLGAVLKACPMWMRIGLLACYLNGIYSFITGVDFSFGTSELTQPQLRLLVISSGWMMFYAAAGAMLYAARTDGFLRERARLEANQRDSSS
jgi:hypothetical protein